MQFSRSFRNRHLVSRRAFRTRILLATTLLALLSLGRGSCPGLSAQATSVTKETPVIFYAMGDVPYVDAEDKLLPQQIAAIPPDAQFLVHLGDIKDGATPCDEAIYKKVAGMLAKSNVPTFVIPGDNEWNDCQKPEQGWKYWQKYFRRVANDD